MKKLDPILKAVRSVWPLIICTIISFSIASIISFDGDFIVLLTIVLSTFTYAILAFFKPVKPEDGISNTRRYLVGQLDQLKKQMFVAALLTIAAGALAVFLTAQAVYDTGRSQAAFSENRSLSLTLDSALSDRTKLFDLLSDPVEADTLDFLKQALSELNSQIASTENLISRDSGRSVTNSDGTISSEFLFQFFSNLFVRLGTIAIVMIVFGICFAQFRRLSTRYQETQQMGLIVTMIEDGIDQPLAKALRDTFHIIDEPQKIEKGSLETALANHLNESMSGWFDKISNSLKREKEKTESQSSAS